MVKVISSIIVLVINVVTAAAMFFAMIITMNGFNDATANIGISLYIILQIIFIILTVAGLYFIFGFVEKHWQLNTLLSTLISISACVIIGLILSFAAVVAGIAATSAAWENR
jgi:hypothetical protein